MNIFDFVLGNKILRNFFLKFVLSGLISLVAKAKRASKKNIYVPIRLRALVYFLLLNHEFFL
jgi:hypothetical protein